MLYNYSITHYMQCKEENANRVIICINRDVMFYRCYVILILRFPETILIYVYSLIFESHLPL